MVSSPGPQAAAARAIPGIRYCGIAISRRIDPVADLISLIRLLIVFRHNRFDLIHSVTPKAGLLAAVAGWLAGVPLRLHTFTGQAWAEHHSFVRWIGKAVDSLITKLNTRCYADSNSQRDYIAAQGVARPPRITVLGHAPLPGWTRRGSIAYGTLQLPFFVINVLLLKFAIATRHSGRVMLASIIGLGANILLNLVLGKWVLTVKSRPALADST